ncbi:maltase A2-like [Cataglyphis hispanica]|uniref:maltase A2-like n=1 Tax=Cataglyphis hispanica TaxID=1086592 RepID=UPI00217F7D5D|nr:maltase A2-like [Cataglyphis hispanica]
MSVLIGCAALVVGIITTMPKKCDPQVEWWQSSTFYEIFPASFQDSTKGADRISDLRGIIMRLNYLKKLGVIRLNSIFSASHYPEYYSEISNMTDVNKDLGTTKDFSVLVREIQKRNMSIILDLPLYPFIKTLSNQSASTAKVNGIEWLRDKRDAANDRVREPSALPASVETIRDVLSSIPPPLKKARREISSSSRLNHQQKDPTVRLSNFGN